MKRQRIIAGLLAVGMSLSFSGCGNNAKKSDGGDDIATLKVYMIGSEATDTKMVIEEVNKQLREKIGAELEWNLISGGGFQEKINMMYAANEVFDICFSGYANLLSSAVENGSLMGLNDLIDENVPELRDKLPQYLWDVATIDGEIYAVPNQQINAVTQALMVFESDAEKYGIDMDKVEKTADLEQFFAQIKAVDPDKWVYRATGSANSLADENSGNYEGLSNGLYYDLDSKKVVNAYKTEMFQSGMKRTREWYEKGYIRPDIASVTNDDEDYYAKKYVFSQNGYRPALEGGDSKFKSYFPGETPIYKVISEPKITTDLADSTMLSISRTSKNPVKAIQYIDLINTDIELYNLLCHGIEGKHWEWTDENKTHIRKLDADAYQPNNDWAYGNQFNSYVVEGNPENIWETEKEFNASAEVSPLLGFRAKTDSVMTEIAQVQAVIAEFKMLDNGSGDWKTYYPQFIERLEKAGIQTLIDEYQKQIDEFLKSKK